ncbi:MAG: DUF2378 family protein [Myxococcaceae bacterium]|nr:DUF2378 family protein [Myxococcaceae bacterium]
MDTRLTFSQTVETLFTRGMGPALPPEAKARLRDDGLDLDRPLLPAYPAGKVAEWIDLALPYAFPNLSRAEALRVLGHQSVSRYGQTIVGRGLVAMLKLLGFRRILDRMPQAMRTGGNYLETKLIPRGVNDVELWINDVNGMPEYFQGILEGTAELCGIKTARAEIVSVEGTGCTLRVRWAE